MPGSLGVLQEVQAREKGVGEGFLPGKRLERYEAFCVVLVSGLLCGFCRASGSNEF